LCTSLESLTDEPPFPQVLRGNYCIPLIGREACSSTSSISIPNHKGDSKGNDGKGDSEVNDRMTQDNVEEDLLVRCAEEEMSPETHTASTEEVLFSYAGVNQSEAERIQAETKEQSKSSAWYKERQCRITASYFGRVCKMRQTRSGNKLAATITSQYKKQHTSLACSWGKDNEPRAITAYIKHMATQHKVITVDQTDLIINPSFSFLGVSPHGLLKDSSETDPNGI